MRESTLAEKWIVREPAKRLKAIADAIVPIWSHRHSAHNWYNAVTERPRTANERVERISRNPITNLGEWRPRGSAPLQLDPEAFRAVVDAIGRHRSIVAEIQHGYGGTRSEVQVRALAELVKNRPPHGHLLLIRPPYSDDFESIIRARPFLAEAGRRLRETVGAIKEKRVLVQWYEAPAEIGLTNQDYILDGLHFNADGVQVLKNHLAQTYRGFYPPKR